MIPMTASTRPALPPVDQVLPLVKAISDLLELQGLPDISAGDHLEAQAKAAAAGARLEEQAGHLALVCTFTALQDRLEQQQAALQGLREQLQVC